MKTTFQGYASCLTTSQEKILKEPAKGMSIKKGPCVVVTQELQFIINLRVLSVFMNKLYSCL